MLFLPLLDRHWGLPTVRFSVLHLSSWITILLLVAVLLIWQPSYAGYFISTLLLAALPEEWFFRAYFMDRMGKGWRANLIASLLFSALHGLVSNWETAFMVLGPSMFYGWLYQRTQNISLLIMVHALSNLIFMSFLQPLMAT